MREAGGSNPLAPTFLPYMEITVSTEKYHLLRPPRSKSPLIVILPDLPPPTVSAEASQSGIIMLKIEHRFRTRDGVRSSFLLIHEGHVPDFVADLAKQLHSGDMVIEIEIPTPDGPRTRSILIEEKYVKGLVSACKAQLEDSEGTWHYLYMDKQDRKAADDERLAKLGDHRPKGGTHKLGKGVHVNRDR